MFLVHSSVRQVNCRYTSCTPHFLSLKVFKCTFFLRKLRSALEINTFHPFPMHFTHTCRPMINFLCDPVCCVNPLSFVHRWIQYHQISFQNNRCVRKIKNYFIIKIRVHYRMTALHATIKKKLNKPKYYAAHQTKMKQNKNIVVQTFKLQNNNRQKSQTNKNPLQCSFICITSHAIQITLQTMTYVNQIKQKQTHQK